MKLSAKEKPQQEHIVFRKDERGSWQKVRLPEATEESVKSYVSQLFPDWMSETMSGQAELVKKAEWIATFAPYSDAEVVSRSVMIKPPATKYCTTLYPKTVRAEASDLWIRRWNKARQLMMGTHWHHLFVGAIREDTESEGLDKHLSSWIDIAYSSPRYDEIVSRLSRADLDSLNSNEFELCGMKFPVHMRVYPSVKLCSDEQTNYYAMLCTMGCPHVRRGDLGRPYGFKRPDRPVYVPYGGLSSEMWPMTVPWEGPQVSPTVDLVDLEDRLKPSAFERFEVIARMLEPKMNPTRKLLVSGNHDKIFDQLHRYVKSFYRNGKDLVYSRGPYSTFQGTQGRGGFRSPVYEHDCFEKDDYRSACLDVLTKVPWHIIQHELLNHKLTYKWRLENAPFSVVHFLTETAKANQVAASRIANCLLYVDIRPDNAIISLQTEFMRRLSDFRFTERGEVKPYEYYIEMGDERGERCRSYVAVLIGLHFSLPPDLHDVILDFYDLIDSARRTPMRSRVTKVLAGARSKEKKKFMDGITVKWGPGVIGPLMLNCSSEIDIHAGLNIAISVPGLLTLGLVYGAAQVKQSSRDSTSAVVRAVQPFGLYIFSDLTLVGTMLYWEYAELSNLDGHTYTHDRDSVCGHISYWPCRLRTHTAGDPLKCQERPFNKQWWYSAVADDVHQYGNMDTRVLGAITPVWWDSGDWGENFIEPKFTGFPEI